MAEKVTFVTVKDPTKMAAKQYRKRKKTTLNFTITKITTATSQQQRTNQRL
jgi:hypothetical protein